jgi:hypothetical protein
MAPSSVSESRHLCQSLRPACICAALHRSCNPRMCSEAAICESLKQQHETILSRSPSTRGSSTLGNEALVETTLNNVRDAALSGCATCGILYAGVKSPLSTDSTWVAEMEEEKVFIVIGESSDFVQVYSFPDGAEPWKYTAFTFYATKGSGKLRPKRANFIP